MSGNAQKFSYSWSHWWNFLQNQMSLSVSTRTHISLPMTIITSNSTWVNKWHKFPKLKSQKALGVLGLKKMLIVFEVYEALSTNALLFFNEISLVSYFMRHFSSQLVATTKSHDNLGEEQRFCLWPNENRG